MCHRLPERSFFYKGHQFPVCARCTGLYTGMAIFFVYLYFNPIKIDVSYLIISIILNVPCFIDGFTQKLKLRESNNYLRLVTGLLAGVGGGLFAFEVAKLITMNIIK